MLTIVGKFDDRWDHQLVGFRKSLLSMYLHKSLLLKRLVCGISIPFLRINVVECMFNSSNMCIIAFCGY